MSVLYIILFFFKQLSINFTPTKFYVYLRFYQKINGYQENKMDSNLRIPSGSRRRCPS